MNDCSIYSSWQSRSSDHRFLRFNRWMEIKKVIQKERLKTVVEFGSGISTALFANLGMSVLSFETDPDYMNFVYNFDLCKGATFILWNNKDLTLKAHFDLALVDGILPRDTQLKVALNCAKYIAIDDFVGRGKKTLSPMLSRLNRVDSGTTYLALFHNERT